MGVKFCNKILTFKMPDTEAGPWACPKLSNYVTVHSDQVRNQLFFIFLAGILSEYQTDLIQIWPDVM